MFTITRTRSLVVGDTLVCAYCSTPFKVQEGKRLHPTPFFCDEGYWCDACNTKNHEFLATLTPQQMMRMADRSPFAGAEIGKGGAVLLLVFLIAFVAAIVADCSR